jgi:tetratricopeptide (TPR) repeat protein
MQPLEPPDAHRLLAACGWLELGCPDDALSELEMLSRENRTHPDVLEMQWLIQAEQKHWIAALSTATQLVEIAPERPAGWLHRAYAMRRVPEGGLQQAWDLLLRAAEKFPKEGVIPYNLSCYACQLKRLDEARKWLKLALGAGKPETMKSMALKDEDLRPLWDELRTM